MFVSRPSAHEDRVADVRHSKELAEDLLMNLSKNARVLEAGDTTIMIAAAGDRVTIAFSGARGFDLSLVNADAAELARAILAASGGEGRAQLPQSRQIGGIIGPY